MLICSLAYLNGQASIDPSVIQSTISTLTSRDNSNKQSIEKGVSQVALSLAGNRRRRKSLPLFL